MVREKAVPGDPRVAVPAVVAGAGVDADQVAVLRRDAVDDGFAPASLIACAAISSSSFKLTPITCVKS
ncbi:hypothetical protein BB31_11140 [Amycolatopsis lurida NRRL 2430]|uniref:Uncharacterized protein n=1 Tax=Amycolatopsis lurida NRRL 2430 TaxID=1460371 RepID=A0A2P2FXG1_AMYLU|nr:hypothetical protein BB31_11140 [Amycolatopsis lurida NRRL 2430]